MPDRQRYPPARAVTHPSKVKGSAFEREVVAYLQSAGFPEAQRAYGAGRADDRGDIVGVDGWVLEVKCHRDMDIGNWMNEAAREARNARCGRFAVIHKRREHGAEEAYITMPLRCFVETP